MIESIKRALEPLRVKVSSLIAKAKFVMSDDSKPIQFVQIDIGKGEPVNCVRLQNFGLSGVPLSGAEALLVMVGGDTPVALAIDDSRKRPKGLNEGETVFYNAFGSKMLLGKEGTEISGKPVKISTDTTISGDLTVNGVKFSDLVKFYNLHTHPGNQTTSHPIPQEPEQ